MTGEDARDLQVVDRLREALQEEARGVVPAGDGLSRIQRRVTARRFRLRWRRPALALAAAAAVAGVVIGGVTLAAGNGNQSLNTPPLGSPTANPPVGVADFPTGAIFPFTSAAAEMQWEQQDYPDGHMPWVASPEGVATSWVASYLEQPSIDQVVSQQRSADFATVTLGRSPAAGSAPVAVTRVHLARYGHGWLVTGATDPTDQLILAEPNPGQVVASPVTVSGPGFGVDESVTAQVRDATTPQSLGAARVAAGSGGSWSTDVSFASPLHRIGVVVAIAGSALDGKPARLVAEQVHFRSAPVTAGPPAAGSVGYGVTHGRLAAFSATTGQVSRYLTAPNAGQLSDPQLVGDRVYFRQAAGGCGGDGLMSVSVTAQTSAVTAVAHPDAGYKLTGYAVSADGNQIALVEEACDPQATTPQGRIVAFDQRTQQQHSIAFPSYPPAPTADPSWEPDGRHLDVFVRTGMQGELARYDAFGANDWSDSTAACKGFDVASALPQAIRVDGTGALWIAAQTGTATQVTRCVAGTPTVAFAVPGNDVPTDLAVTATGSHVLLTDANGGVWRWDGSGTPARIPGLTLTAAAW